MVDLWEIEPEGSTTPFCFLSLVESFQLFSVCKDFSNVSKNLKVGYGCLLFVSAHFIFIATDGGGLLFSE
jgi:hypothetical protein